MLLVAVLGIWGTITFKVINGLNPEQPPSTALEFEATFHPKSLKDIDTFAIKAIERDPFLGKMSKTENHLKKNNKTLRSNVKFPHITYNGLIKKEGNANRIFVVEINNQQHLLKRGQTIHGVKLISGYKSSITVSYKGHTQTIKL